MKKKKKKSKEVPYQKKTITERKDKKLSTYDYYRQWDKFDVVGNIYFYWFPTAFPH